MEQKYNQYIKEIGERIKNLREKNKESQAKLADILCLTQNAVSKIENGDVALTLENQLRIAEHYNVSHDYICTGIDRDFILDTLTKYVNLQYDTISIGIESFMYYNLKINKIFLNYLTKAARIQWDSSMPQAIKDEWLATEKENFYKNNRKEEIIYDSVVPVIEDLFLPDDEKKEWKQADLLRENDIRLRGLCIHAKEEPKHEN